MQFFRTIKFFFNLTLNFERFFLKIYCSSACLLKIFDQILVGTTCKLIPFLQKPLAAAWRVRCKQRQFEWNPICIQFARKTFALRGEGGHQYAVDQRELEILTKRQLQVVGRWCQVFHKSKILIPCSAFFEHPSSLLWIERLSYRSLNDTSKPNGPILFSSNLEIIKTEWGSHHPKKKKWLAGWSYFYLFRLTDDANPFWSKIIRNPFVSSLFCKLSALLRQKLSSFGSDVNITVRCLQVLIKAVDVKLAYITFARWLVTDKLQVLF